MLKHNKFIILRFFKMRLYIMKLFSFTKNYILNSAWVPLCTLCFLILYAYSPFISEYNIGASDAQIYQYVLHDALIQLKHGIFPAYIGQSEFSYFGMTFMRAPYYIVFSQLLDVVTLHQLNSTYIQHLTVLVSAVGAGLLTYFLLFKINPASRWIALLLAFLYVTCPGVMGLIYNLDMYFSFMTLPYIPIFIYGLIRIHQKHDLFSHIITGTSLSFIFMAHPPVAFWCVVSTCLFYLLQLVAFRKGIIGLLIIGFMFLLLNLWQIVCVHELNLTNLDLIKNVKIDVIKQNLLNVIDTYVKQEVPGSFFPLSQQMVGLSYLQLGYSLWIVLFGCVIVGLRRNTFLIRSLLIITILLLMLIYPIPILSRWLWSFFPANILAVNQWPMQRLYIITSIFVCFLGIGALEKILLSLNKSIKYLLLVTGIGCGIWNIYQVQYFLQVGEARKDHNTNWLNSEDVRLFPLLVYGMTGNKKDVGHPGSFIPQLKSKLINELELPIENYDNQHIVNRQCFESHSKIAQIALLNTKMKFPFRVDSDSFKPFLEFTLITKDPHLLLCLIAHADKKVPIKIWSTISLDHSYPHIEYNSFEETNDGENVLTMPIYNPSMSKNDLHIYFLGKANINSIKMINYNLTNLPIHVESLTPYRASVETKLDNVYLDMYKSYYPGYQAKVNGEVAPVLQTKNGNIKILLPKKGKYTVDLVYVGTTLMKISFYVSLTAWGCLLFYFILIGMRVKLIYKYIK